MVNTALLSHVPQCNISGRAYAIVEMTGVGVKVQKQLNRMGNQILACWLMVLLCLISGGCDQAEKPKGLRLGGNAPDFAIKDINDRVIVLSSLKGSPVILRFFETNCRFCRADTPVFQEFYDKHRDKGLQIIYIGSFYEKRELLQAFAEELQIEFPVAMDTGAKLADLYDIKAYPQTIFISPDQKILAALLGGVGQAELQEIMGKHL